ncbi:hypothetical protein [Rhizobium sp. BK312]|uniref:hypothetical protein n=1 Tax=Rhizobium sp. BK312 TaxID=2587080 RepID=UPI000DD69499
MGDRHVAKCSVVNPGERLSRRYHNHRLERWTAVSGHGVAEIDGTEHALSSGTQSILRSRRRTVFRALEISHWFSSKDNTRAARRERYY